MDQPGSIDLETLFHAALEYSPEARSAFLAGACSGNPELREKVELLLSSDREAGSFLNSPDSSASTTRLTASLGGRQLGAYRVVALLGAGGMGEVYRAHDGKLGRDVAIKCLPAEFARDPARVARLRKEARALAALNHPNIGAIYGFEQADDLDFLVLELVEGETLSGPLPVPMALDRAGQVAAALQAAHDRGIVHRDLKPANIKVTPSGLVKVLDFGLAKLILGPAAEQDLLRGSALTGDGTLAGLIVGTPSYMSPEQARGEEVDARTDVWAFGCLLFELLTGKRAFRGDTIRETISAVLEREAEWTALPAKVPSNVRRLLRHCLDKNPALRPKSIGEAGIVIQRAQHARSLWQIAAAAAGIVAITATGTALRMRTASTPLDRSDWVQITNMTDSAGQPALSPDGRIMAFIRGPSTFVTPGQVYVKMLPSGEPVALTRDANLKMSPIFSPDGTKIAYTARVPPFNWDTWIVPVTGGEPRLWLRNASGLVWSGPHQVLFSEIKQGLHMGIVTADENRGESRDVYLPDNERGMAHRSWPSPDGKWILLVEMDKDGLFPPCRVVPADGSSAGRQLGPPGADCTFGAWSPDGKWVYLTSKAGGFHHIWRQRFPNGVPEQITSGPTEEEGVAIAPDGRSFITAVAIQTGALWIHDDKGERQLSLEGNAFYARFTPDGTKVCYLSLKSVGRAGTTRDPGEVWVADLETGRSEPLVPGVTAMSYDVSPDGRQVVMEVSDSGGRPHLWLAPFDRSSPPRQIPNVEGREVRFGGSGDVFFRRAEGSSGFLYRVHQDGSGLRKALDKPILILFGLSPDEQWILAWAALSGNARSANQAIPLNGGAPITVGSFGWEWSADQSSMGIFAGERSYIVPLRRGAAIPALPPAGLQNEKDVAALPGAVRADHPWVSPAPGLGVYAFYRGAVQRNLYRIPIR